MFKRKLALPTAHGAVGVCVCQHVWQVSQSSLAKELAHREHPLKHPVTGTAHPPPHAPQHRYQVKQGKKLLLQDFYLLAASEGRS